MHTLDDNNKTNPPHGLVIAYFGNSVAVEAADGQVLQCHLHRNQALPVVGDRVAYQQENNDTATITHILPRHSLLTRGDGHDNVKPLAANIDVIAIIMAPPPVFSEYLVDRYLIAAELLAISPIIVLNKIDLLTETTRDATLALLQTYQAISYPVILSSIYTLDGLHALSTQLKHKTAVLVGPSGVGKSSIIAALGHDNILVGDVSPKGAGKHTTTATRLYHLPEATHIIDSPGVREFNLWPISKDDLFRGFKEFQPFLGQCKFRNCLHHVEPHCAIQTAASHGKISPKRLANYHTLLKKIGEQRESRR